MGNPVTDLQNWEGLFVCEIKLENSVNCLPIIMSACSFASGMIQGQNRWTDSVEISYERYATEGNPETAYINL